MPNSRYTAAHALSTTQLQVSSQPMPANDEVPCYWSGDRACSCRHSKTRSRGVNAVMWGCSAATVARSADAASCTPSSVYFSSRTTPCTSRGNVSGTMPSTVRSTHQLHTSCTQEACNRLQPRIFCEAHSVSKREYTVAAVSQGRVTGKRGHHTSSRTWLMMWPSVYGTNASNCTIASSTAASTVTMRSSTPSPAPALP